MQSSQLRLGNINFLNYIANLLFEMRVVILLRLRLDVSMDQDVKRVQVRQILLDLMGSQMLCDLRNQVVKCQPDLHGLLFIVFDPFTTTYHADKLANEGSQFLSVLSAVDSTLCLKELDAYAVDFVLVDEYLVAVHLLVFPLRITLVFLLYLVHLLGQLCELCFE